MSELKKYKFKLNHDNGHVIISTMAQDIESAKKLIACAEGCPESALQFWGTRFIKDFSQLWIDTGHNRTKNFVEMMDLACFNYQHCLKRDKYYLACEFAEEIKRVYSLDNPQNKAVYNFLMSL